MFAEILAPLGQSDHAMTSSGSHLTVGPHHRRNALAGEEGGIHVDITTGFNVTKVLHDIDNTGEVVTLQRENPLVVPERECRQRRRFDVGAGRADDAVLDRKSVV